MRKRMEKNEKWLDWAVELQSIAQAGLFYGKDSFDLERYGRIREIAAEMLSYKTEIPLEKVKDLFCGDVGYQTPKLDTRAAIFKDIVSNGVCSYPGEAKRQGSLSMHLKAGSGQMPELNRALACMDTGKKTQPIAEVIAAETAKHKREHIYILISKNQDETLLPRLRALAGGDNQILWIVPLHPAMEFMLSQAAGIRAVRWEVTA